MKRFLTALIAVVSLILVALLLTSCGGKGNHTHEFGEWRQLEPATCTTDGMELRTCECSAGETRKIPAFGHKTVTVEGTAPTCTTPGLTDGLSCDNCGRSQLDQTVIPATGHDYRMYNCINCNDTLTVSIGLSFVSNGDGTCYVSGIGDCTDVYILVPEFHNGMKVVGIGENAFSDCKTIISILLPDSVTVVGKSAFAGCTSLESVTLLGALTLESNAFSGCSSLSYISLSVTLSDIKADVLAGCISLRSVFIPSTVASIHESAFMGLDNLSILSDTAEIPDGWNLPLGTSVTTHTHDFGDWITTRQPTCTTPGSKVQICDCGGKTAAEIGVKPHTPQAVPGTDPTCTSTGLTDGEVCSVCGTTTVEQQTVGMLPHTDETVPGTSASCSATGLTDGKKCSVCGTVTLEQQIIPAEHIYENGSCIFCGISNGSVGLAYQLSSNKQYYTVVGIGDCTDTDIIIPAFHEGIPVLYVGPSAFNGNKNITSLKISDGILGISEKAFYQCSSLRALDLGNTVQTIGKNAFRECTSLIHLVIPDSVTKLTEYAFNRCYRLSTVVIGSGVTKIEDFTFYMCHSLSRIVIGENVTSLGYDPFFQVHSLIEVYNLSGVTLDSSFKRASDIYTSLDSESHLFETPDGFMMYENGDVCYLVTYNGFESVITLPESCNGKSYAIYDYAFYKIGDFLESVTLSSRVTEIRDHAFYAITSLKTINIPGEELRVIGDAVFMSCSSLTELVIPEGVTRIGNLAFSGCLGLKTLILPDSLVHARSVVSSLDSLEYNVYGGARYIGSKTNPYLYFCSVIDNTVTSIDIHPDTKFIGNSAFSKCASLTEIVIPRGVIMIDTSAFYAVSGSVSIYIPDTVIYVRDNLFYNTGGMTVYIEADSIPETWTNGWNNVTLNIVLGTYVD